jgi:hypothetical protein
MLSRNKRQRRDRLISATLRCRLCSRPVGDLIGYGTLPLKEARFIPVPGGRLPRTTNGRMRCFHCNGQLGLDDVEPLGWGVSLSEVGGRKFSEVI